MRFEPYRRSILTALVIVCFVALLVTCAWQSDDAFVTFRTVDNWWRGYGLRWNIDERVQSYTSPLWMLCSAAVFGMANEAYFSTLILSFATMALLAWLIARRAATTTAAVASVVVLAASRAVVDYGVCGLENPLLFLLLAIFAHTALKKASPQRLFQASLLTALVALTRPDAVLLPLPALGFLLAQAPRSERRRWVLRAALGLVPIALWEAFSLVYYGFLFPNTAYAKLDLPISRWTLLQHGFFYFVDSLTRDPLTLTIVATAIVTAVWRAKRPDAEGSAESNRGPDRGRVARLAAQIRVEHALAAGIALDLVFVLVVGGDFMSGRFFGAPFIVALVLVQDRVDALPPRAPAIAAAVCVVVALVMPHSHWLGGTSYGEGRKVLRESHATHRIADERAYYYPTTGLLRVLPRFNELQAGISPIPPYRNAIQGFEIGLLAEQQLHGQAVVAAKEVGFFGYFAGPGVHVVDVFALADPLLARLPFTPNAKWRIGHFQREIPAGYLDLLRGTGQIEDAAIADFYAQIALVTRGPIWSGPRWKAIFRLMTRRAGTTPAR